MDRKKCRRKSRGDLRGKANRWPKLRGHLKTAPTSAFICCYIRFSTRCWELDPGIKVVIRSDERKEGGRKEIKKGSIKIKMNLPKQNSAFGLSLVASLT